MWQKVEEVEVGEVGEDRGNSIVVRRQRRALLALFGVAVAVASVAEHPKPGSGGAVVSRRDHDRSIWGGPQRS